jgi:hypothetical protein
MPDKKSARLVSSNYALRRARMLVPVICLIPAAGVYKKSMHGSSRLPRSSTHSAEQIYHRSVECRDVIGLAARDEVAVDDYLLIHPFGAGVPEISLKCWPRGYLSPARRSSFDDSPWAVTDHRHWLIRIEEGLYKFNRFWLHSQLVRVHYASWKQQRTEFLRPGTFKVHIDLKFVTPVFRIPSANMIAFGRYDDSFGAGLI